MGSRGYFGTVFQSLDDLGDAARMMRNASRTIKANLSYAPELSEMVEQLSNMADIISMERDVIREKHRG